MKVIYISIGLLLLTILGVSSHFIYFALQPKPLHHELSPVQMDKLNTTLIDPESDKSTDHLHFKMLDLDGKMRSTTEWANKVLVLNFWATWCPPCIKEIPMFVQLQKQYAAQDLQFIGIAVDSLNNVKQFTTQIQFNYPILVEEQKAIRIAESLGNQNGILPFTIVLDKKGEIISRHLGEFTQEDVEQILLPFITK